MVALAGAPSSKDRSVDSTPRPKKQKPSKTCPPAQRGAGDEPNARVSTRLTRSRRQAAEIPETDVSKSQEDFGRELGAFLGKCYVSGYSEGRLL